MEALPRLLLSARPQAPLPLANLPAEDSLARLQLLLSLLALASRLVEVSHPDRTPLLVSRLTRSVAFTQGGSAFGASNTTAPASGGLFGAPKPATTFGGFGATAQQPSQPAAGGLFGGGEQINCCGNPHSSVLTRRSSQVQLPVRSALRLPRKARAQP